MGLRERVSQASRLGARGRARPSDSLGGPGKLPTLVAAQCGVRGAGVARTVRLWRRIGEHIAHWRIRGTQLEQWRQHFARGDRKWIESRRLGDLMRTAAAATPSWKESEGRAGARLSSGPSARSAPERAAERAQRETPIVTTVLSVVTTQTNRSTNRMCGLESHGRAMEYKSNSTTESCNQIQKERVDAKR